MSMSVINPKVDCDHQGLIHIIMREPQLHHQDIEAVQYKSPQILTEHYSTEFFEISASP